MSFTTHMRFGLAFALLSLSLHSFAESPAVFPAPSRERVYVGMVADECEGAQPGLLVRAVAPASPAYKAGVRAGDVVLRAGVNPVNSRSDLRQVVRKGVCGERLPVELIRAGKRLVLQVVLELRPDSSSHLARTDSPLGADRHIQPIRLPDNIRQEIRRHRRLLREQLASLPDGLEPRVVTRALQAIRDLARDAHAARPGWMAGRAGEISVRFRDEEGSVVLYGANNLVSLEVYDIEGQLLARYELNSEAERRALSAAVLQRLQRLR